MTQISNMQSISPEALVEALAGDAKKASAALMQANTATINAVLDTLAAKLRASEAQIIDANKKDLALAEQKGLTAAMCDRLELTPARIEGMAAGVDVVRNLADPVGKILHEINRPNGLKIERVAVPIGVLGMIYESRPNVTIDAAALCLKSRNAVILRGGSESLNSSLALHALIQESLEEHGLPAAAVGMIPTTDRAAVGALLRAEHLVDLIIPRGGRGLIERVMNESRMPVFSHLDGICHTYIHESADPDMAHDVTLNAKMRRTGVCNATETLLLDQNLDDRIKKRVLSALLDAGCTIVGDAQAQTLDDRITAATQEDWDTEYLDTKLSCAIVNNVEAAVEHINQHGSHHTDSIIGEESQAVAYFLQNVDSGSVMHNASTQFADGGEYGMGAEIGIATGKMHARGPVGVEQLCTYKYVVHGTGQTRPV